MNRTERKKQKKLKYIHETFEKVVLTKSHLLKIIMENENANERKEALEEIWEAVHRKIKLDAKTDKIQNQTFYIAAHKLLVNEQQTFIDLIVDAVKNLNE